MENGHHGDHGVNVQTAVELLIKQGYETVLIQSLRTVALSAKAKMKIPSNAEIPQKNVASSHVAQNMNSDPILALCILRVELQRPKLRQCSNVANISNGKMTKQFAYIMVRSCKLNIKTQSDLFHTFQNHYTKFKLWKVWEATLTTSIALFYCFRFIPSVKSLARFGIVLQKSKIKLLFFIIQFWYLF